MTRYASTMTGTTPADRYALLVEQLGEELGYKRGWMTAVAKKLGVHRSYVSRIHAGDRTGIGSQAIDRAIQRLSLDPQFFYGRGAASAERRSAGASPETTQLAEAGTIVELRWAILRDLARRVGPVFFERALAGLPIDGGYAQFFGVLADEVREMPVFAYASKIKDLCNASKPLDPLLAAVFVYLVVGEGEAHIATTGVRVEPFPTDTLRAAVDHAEREGTDDPDLLSFAKATLDHLEKRGQRRPG